MTNGQKSLLSSFGFDREERIEVEFGNCPRSDLEAVGIYPGATIAVVAPHHVIYSLILDGYKVIEFVNRPSARKRGVFICDGAYMTQAEEVILSTPALCPTPDHAYKLSRSFFPCPVPESEQEAGDLSPMKE
jgi:hypothetical protein